MMWLLCFIVNLVGLNCMFLMRMVCVCVYVVGVKVSRRVVNIVWWDGVFILVLFVDVWCVVGEC